MKRRVLIPLLTLCLAVLLYFVNRDLYSYRYDTLCRRSFSSADAKGDYLVSEQIALKPGVYVLSPEITVEGAGSGLYMVDGNGTEFFSTDLEPGCQNPDIPFEIQNSAKQIRVGVRYDPESSSVHLNRICISAEHVLYRESLLYHLTLSLVCVLLAGLLVLRFCFRACFFRLFPFLENNELPLLAILLLTILTSYPFFNPDTYIDGQDMFFHITRIRGLADSLKAGYFPVRDQLYWLNNYGYGVGFYYPDVFLYFPAVLLLLGFQLLTSYKIFLVVCAFLSIAVSFIAVYRISGKKIAGYGAAILMACSSYRLSNLYYRGAVGETQAAVFYPLILWGLYEILYGEKRRWSIFALGFWGLLSCHIISTFMAFCVTALVLLFHAGRILKNREILYALLKSVLLVLLGSAFFLLPMAEQTLTYPDLRVNSLIDDGARWMNFNYAFPVENLLALFKPWNFAYQARSVYPGWAYLLVLLLRLFLLGKKRDTLFRRADGMLGLALVLLVMCTDVFPWSHFLWFVNRVQFAYRLLLPSTVLIAAAGGIYLSVLLKPGKPYIGLCLLFVLSFFSTAFPVLYESAQHRSIAKNLFVMQDNRVSGAEYLPVDFPQTFPGKNADTVLLEDGDPALTILAHDRKGLSFSFDYELPADSGKKYFMIPLVYYTGFKGTLTDESGETTALEIESDPQGLVMVSNHGSRSGHVSVWFDKTPAARIGEITSLITFLLCLLYCYSCGQNTDCGNRYLFWNRRRKESITR